MGVTDIAIYFTVIDYVAANQALYQAPIFSNFVVSEFYWTSTTDASRVRRPGMRRRPPAAL